MSEKDKLQLELYGLHREAVRMDRRKRAENAASVQRGWPSTLAWIDQLKTTNITPA